MSSLAARGARRDTRQAQDGGRAEVGRGRARASASSQPPATGDSSSGRHPAPPIAKSTSGSLQGMRASRQDHDRRRQHGMRASNRCRIRHAGINCRLVDDSTGCRASNRPAGHIEGNAGRLGACPCSRTRPTTTPPSPRSGPQRPPVQRGAGRRRRHRRRTPVVHRKRPDRSGQVPRLCDGGRLPRIGPRREASIKKRHGQGKHFAHVRKKMSDGRQGCRPSASFGRKTRKCPRKGAQCCPPSWPTRTFRPTFLQGFRRYCLQSRGSGRCPTSSPPPFRPFPSTVPPLPLHRSAHLRAAPHAAPAVRAASGRFLRLNRTVQPLRVYVAHSSQCIVAHFVISTIHLPIPACPTWRWQIFRGAAGRIPRLGRPNNSAAPEGLRSNEAALDRPPIGALQKKPT